MFNIQYFNFIGPVSILLVVSKLIYLKSDIMTTVVVNAVQHILEQGRIS